MEYDKLKYFETTSMLIISDEL